jgi:two-component system response regulator FixJ
MASDSTVYVIDDDDAVRESLVFLLQTSNLTVRSYNGATAFLADVGKLGAGCIITDVRMPEIDGIELLRRLRTQGVTLPVIVITGHGDVPLAVEAMKIGALDFLEKPFDDEVLLTAVQTALNQHLGSVERNEAKVEINERLTKLSMRERQVLEGLVAGKANKVIAYDHGISPRTVEIYRANVMTKMEASSLSDLVRMAIVGGILDGVS